MGELVVTITYLDYHTLSKRRTKLSGRGEASEEITKKMAEDADEEVISAVDAVTLLAACQRTAEKLVSGGSRTFLDKEDLATLRGFKAVKVAGWADNLEVLGIAGLSMPQVAALAKALERFAGQI